MPAHRPNYVDPTLAGYDSDERMPPGKGQASWARELGISFDPLTIPHQELAKLIQDNLVVTHGIYQDARFELKAHGACTIVAVSDNGGVTVLRERDNRRIVLKVKQIVQGRKI
jgi:hypothetical protein